jgi:hypothetical protein
VKVGGGVFFPPKYTRYVGWQEDLAKIGCSADRKIMEIINIKKKKKKVSAAAIQIFQKI